MRIFCLHFRGCVICIGDGIPTFNSFRESIAKEDLMSSKTFQKKMIKKRKKRAHRANLKADQKRMDHNHAVIYGQSH